LQANRLGLVFPRSGSNGGIQTPHRSPLMGGPKGNVEAYRTRWLATLKRYPHASRTELRTIQPAAYVFLRRYDSNWLLLNNPPEVKINNPRLRVNWATRDRQLAKEVRRCGLRLLALLPPVRLTRTAILREAKCIWVNSQKLRLLPSTRAILARIVEGRLAFALRRIAAVAQYSAETGKPLKVWQISRMSGLREDLVGHPFIRNALRKAASNVAADRANS
jgi:hypothetical protein